MKSIRHFAPGIERRRTAAALIARAMSLAEPHAAGVALADTGSTDSSAVSSAAAGSGAEDTSSTGDTTSKPRSGRCADLPAGTTWVFDHPFLPHPQLGGGRAVARQPGRDDDVSATDADRLRPGVQPGGYRYTRTAQPRVTTS